MKLPNPAPVFCLLIMLALAITAIGSTFSLGYFAGKDDAKTEMKDTRPYIELPKHNRGRCPNPGHHEKCFRFNP